MHVLISGAGPAGLTLAVCLAQHGIKSTIVEKAAENATSGYGIGLHVNGWRVMERLDLIEQFQAHAMTLGPAKYFDRYGKSLFSYDYRDFADAADHRMLAILREDVQRILKSAVKDIAEIRFATTIVGIVEMDQGIDINFSDGTSGRYDIVVGADGYRSGTRELSFGPHEYFLRSLGYRAAAWRMTLEAPLNASFVGVMDVNRQAGLYDVGDGTAATLFCWRDVSTDYVKPEERGDLLTRIFGRLPTPVDQAMEIGIDWERAYFDTISQIEVPSWSKGRTVLLGDAAWCLTFFSGQGTSMAFAGAFILAQELATKPYQPAFRSYETRMRPLIRKLQAMSRKIGGRYVPRSHLGITFQSWLLPILLSRRFAKFTSRRIMAPEVSLEQQRNGA